MSEDREVRVQYEVRYKNHKGRKDFDDRKILPGVHGRFDTLDSAQEGAAKAEAWFNERTEITLGKDGAGMEHVVSEKQLKRQNADAFIVILHDGVKVGEVVEGVEILNEGIVAPAKQYEPEDEEEDECDDEEEKPTEKPGKKKKLQPA